MSNNGSMGQQLCFNGSVVKVKYLGAVWFPAINYHITVLRRMRRDISAPHTCGVAWLGWEPSSPLFKHTVADCYRDFVKAIFLQLYKHRMLSRTGCPLTKFNRN